MWISADRTIFTSALNLVIHQLGNFDITLVIFFKVSIIQLYYFPSLVAFVVAPFQICFWAKVVHILNVIIIPLLFV